MALFSAFALLFGVAVSPDGFDVADLSGVEPAPLFSFLVVAAELDDVALLSAFGLLSAFFAVTVSTKRFERACLPRF